MTGTSTTTCTTARDMILCWATRDDHEVDVPGIVPKRSVTPGGILNVSVLRIERRLCAESMDGLGSMTAE
jgi:hypothetical protein